MNALPVLTALNASEVLSSILVTAGPSPDTRPMVRRVAVPVPPPPSVPKYPPTRMSPFDCMAAATMAESAPGLKVESSEPSG